MISWWLLLTIALGYVLTLFAIAWVSDRPATQRRLARWQPLIYPLSLAVYLTSWTFYGAVGTASQTGWGFLPIFLGPALVIVFGWPVFLRILAVARRQNLTSIADFLAARYGKARSLAMLITIIATVGSVPYIALQFKAVVTGLELVTDLPLSRAADYDTALFAAAGLALFAAVFGTRRIDAEEHNHGLVVAIAFESLIKLLAFVAIGGFAIYLLLSASGETSANAQSTAKSLFLASELPAAFLPQTLLAALAILCLPRQFHVAFVEGRSDREPTPTRWLFPGILVIFGIFVLPITVAGLTLLPTGVYSGDAFVLALPLTFDAPLLTVLAYLGGFSAATGMVIVASVALATMISNEIIMPLLLRRGDRPALPYRDYARTLVLIRRAAIFGIAMLAYVYYRLTDSSTLLASMGLLSFAAVAQFGPLLLAGLYWSGATLRGALIGLSAGFALWCYTLLLPALASSGAMSAEWVTAGPFGLGWLRPEALFFDAGLSPLTHGVLWSLGLNTALLVVFSRRGVVALTEQIQARAFATTPLPTPPKPANVAGRVPLADLVALAGRFVGQQAAERAFSAFAADHGDALEANGAADRETVQFTERLLASAVGASSARFVMTTAMRKRGLELADVVLLLDETSQAIRFNRQLLENTLENMSQGVSVVDGAQSLIGWNSQYVSMMGFPEGMVEVGRPIADLIRYNAKRGCFRSSDVEHEISKRLGHLRSGSAYRYESTFIDGRVLEIRGKPLPDGGFVTTYSDITEYKRVEAELEESKLGLAKRVAERTAELEVAVRELDKARLVAESANASKTRFIAAAAHDLLQPLNAAKLFTALLVDAGDKNDAERQQLAERVEKGLTSVEELLSGLLDVARLDTNAPTPSLEHTAVADIFAQLEQQFRDSFERDGLSLRFVATKLWVHTDRALLRRILQNFISNARRYTNTGGVVVGCRRRGTDVAIQVVDTGVGVADEQSMQIFEEFSRGSSTRKAEKRGLGLGLSIVRRIAALLGHPIAMRSTVGRGSVFEIEVPRGRVQLAQPSPTAPAPPAFTSLSGQCVVCIDNDIDILDGMGALLRQWGATPVLAIDADEALDQLNHPGQLQRPSLLLVDYQLDNGVTGLAAIASVRAALGEDVPAVIVTANRSRSIRDAVADAGFRLINKPVKPAALRALISRLTHASRVAKAG